VFCSFPDYFHFLILKKGKKSHNRREQVKFKISLISHDVEESIQLYYSYLSASILEVLVTLTIWGVILGVLVILTIWAVIFLFHCHTVIFLFNKLGN